MNTAELVSTMPSMLSDSRALIECESPSSDIAAIARSASAVAEVGSRTLGSKPERLNISGWTHLRWKFGSGPTRVLLLMHHDTVWPIGTLGTRPFSLADGKLSGPGCFDMKVGIVMAMHAVAGLQCRDGITMLITGDEEIGSGTSRSLIEKEALGANAALVMEPSAADGAIKTERKGAAFYEVTISGSAAHTGLEPENGINAIHELAHQIRAISQLGDAHRGTTVTPTMASAGSAINAVPALAQLSVDVRAWSLDEFARVDLALHRLQPQLSGSSVIIQGELNRPPLERAASSRLLERAHDVSERIGLPPLKTARAGGASDGNFTAALGTPTLDGLGAVGAGAHSDEEHVLIGEIPKHTLLLKELIAEALTLEAMQLAR